MPPGVMWMLTRESNLFAEEARLLMGLGLKLYNALQLGFHDQVCTMVLLILALVVLSDALSDALRRSWLAPAALRRESSQAAAARLLLRSGGLAA